jgi:hypothetical protein
VVLKGFLHSLRVRGRTRTGASSAIPAFPRNPRIGVRRHAAFGPPSPQRTIAIVTATEAASESENLSLLPFTLPTT